MQSPQMVWLLISSTRVVRSWSVQSLFWVSWWQIGQVGVCSVTRIL